MITKVIDGASSVIESKYPGVKKIDLQDHRSRRVWKDGATFHITQVCYVEVTNNKGNTYYNIGLDTDYGCIIYLSMLANSLKRVKGGDGKLKDLQLECDLFTVANKYRADLHPELKGKGEFWAANQILNDVKDKTIIVSRSPYYTVIGNRNGRMEEYETTFPLFNFL